jgi:hypothetical protein
MPTSKGLSYSMNSLPRIAWTMGDPQLSCELHQLVVGAGAARPAEDGHPLRGIERGGEASEVLVGGIHGRDRVGESRDGATRSPWRGPRPRE